MKGAFGVKDRDTSVCHESSSGIRDIHDPPLFTDEKLDSVLGFQISDLFAECRLGDMQPKSRLREVQLFGQYNDRIQVPNFHGGTLLQTPFQGLGDTRSFVLPFVGEATSGYNIRSRLLLKSFPKPNK